MNITYSNFTDQTVTLKLVCDNGSVAEKIINSVSSPYGNAGVIFAQISDNSIKRAEKILGHKLEDGHDKYLLIIDEDIEVFYTTPISKIYAAYAICNHYDNGIKRCYIRCC